MIVCLNVKLLADTFGLTDLVDRTHSIGRRAMYRKILVALENSRPTTACCRTSRNWPSCCGSELLLVHVADGWVARNFDQLKLAESEEMKADRDYLETRARELRTRGCMVSARLALGDPPAEILKTADEEQCDLIAMTTHGHRLIGDLLLGSTIDPVRHRASVPVLLVRAPRR